MASPAHGPSSPDQVVAAIRRGIMLGRYVPGQRLIEADLTRDLGVSRGPVREALKRLAAEGVVALSPHRGAYIRALTRKEVDDLLEVLEMIVSIAAYKAALHIGEGDHRARLAAAFKRLQRHDAMGDPIALAIDRTAFYDCIFAIGGNHELARLNPAVPTLILRIQVQPFRSAQFRAQQFADYGLLYAAINSGKAAAARRIAQKHVRHSRAHAHGLPDAAFALAADGDRPAIGFPAPLSGNFGD
jgi:DNA-binding GntR family transcriptional regulator